MDHVLLAGTDKNEVDFLARYETARNFGLQRSKCKYTPFGYYITQVEFESAVIFEAVMNLPAGKSYETCYGEARHD
jgi:hypothetical protein